MIDELLARVELIAIAILVLGVVAARLAAMAAGALLGFIDRRTARLATTDQSVISPELVRVTRAIVFWLILILAVSYALRVLGVEGVSSILAAVIEFIPQLLVGFAIVIAGHVLGLAASQLVAELDEDLSVDSLGPRLLHGTIFVIALVMGLKHINVDISFITQLVLITVTVIGGGLMLAFALGARRHVANLLARRELSYLSVGDRVRIDDIEGEVVAVRVSRVEIATDEGIASIPASRLAETSVVILTEH